MRAIHAAIGRWTVLLMGLLAGCEGYGPPDPPTTSEVAGSYQATRFEIARDGQWTDALAVGTELSITLWEDGTVQGRLFLPEMLVGSPAGQETTLAGTWSFYYSWQVQLDLNPASTILTGVRFRVGPQLLDSTYPTNVTENLRITLTRQAE